VHGLKRIAPAIAAEYSRTQLSGGELLITLVGAIGRTAVAPPELFGANTARAVGVIPLSGPVNAAWVELWFRSPSKQIEMVGKAHEVARKTLNLEDVRAAGVAVPPRAEQDEIVARVEALVGASELGAGISDRDAQALRQAILKAAFEGRLVPQDRTSPHLRFSSGCATGIKGVEGVGGERECQPIFYIRHCRA
jgi:type I restriction enzyme S subunit